MYTKKHGFAKKNYWVTGYRYGGIEAVREFCVLEHWEIIYSTMEIKDNPSFPIRKIGQAKNYDV